LYQKKCKSGPSAKPEAQSQALTGTAREQDSWFSPRAVSGSEPVSNRRKRGSASLMYSYIKVKRAQDKRWKRCRIYHYCY